MRRAINLLLAVAAVSTVLAPSVNAAEAIFNAIGLIDYSRKPDLRPGDWVTYHFRDSDEEGRQNEQRVTVLIAGEERFWGEECFWVETLTEAVDGGSKSSVATLMSYSIFEDSLAMRRMKSYMRKAIYTSDDEGNPIQEVIKVPPGALRIRDKSTTGRTLLVDTVGVDTVNVAAGLFTCQKVRLREGVSVTSDRPDSTTQTDTYETRTIYMSKEIPVTGIAREVVERTLTQKSWQVGRSANARTILDSRAEGEARLEAFGAGRKSNIIPERFQRPQREQDAAARRATRGTRGGG